jgi:hypothetical protein
MRQELRDVNDMSQMGEGINNHGDALPTPRRTQMRVQVENSGRRKNRGTFPSSQHFEG